MDKDAPAIRCPIHIVEVTRARGRGTIPKPLEAEYSLSTTAGLPSGVLLTSGSADPTNSRRIIKNRGTWTLVRKNA